MGEQLPIGKYSRQTENLRRVVKKPFEILYLARLEKAREEEEKPDSIRH